MSKTKQFTGRFDGTITTLDGGEEVPRATSDGADKVGTVTAASPDEPGEDKKPTDEVGTKTDDPAAIQKKVDEANAAAALAEERGKAKANAEAEAADGKQSKFVNGLFWTLLAIALAVLIFFAIQYWRLNQPDNVAATPPAPPTLTAPATTEWSKGGSQPSEY